MTGTLLELALVFVPVHAFTLTHAFVLCTCLRARPHLCALHMRSTM
jgi:hypothetical protein